MSTHRAFPKSSRKNNGGIGNLSPSAACPCRSEEPISKTYGECCGFWHEGYSASPQRFAPTPEALMRSRYSAYALKLADYLLATWYSESSPGEIDFPSTKWLGLEIKHSATSGNGAGDAGIVEFVARYRDSMGKAGRLHETSRFIRQGVGDAARWLYIDGQFAGEPEESTQTSFSSSRHLPPEEASQELPDETKREAS